MPSLLTQAQKDKIVSVLQDVKDTFIVMQGGLNKRLNAFGWNKKEREILTYQIQFYKVEQEAPPANQLQGIINQSEEVVYIDYTTLLELDLISGTGTVNIIPGQDTLEYESRTYEILQVTNVGWFNGNYQLIKLQVKQTMMQYIT